MVNTLRTKKALLATVGASIMMGVVSTPAAHADPQDGGNYSAKGPGAGFDPNRESTVVEFQPIDQAAIDEMYKTRGITLDDDTEDTSSSTTKNSSTSSPSRETSEKSTTSKKKTTRTVTVTATPENEELPPEWDGYIYDQDDSGASGSSSGVPLGDMEIDYNKSVAERAVQLAASRIGLPYVYGGNSWESGLDCSSLMQQSYARVGVTLPRTTWEQVNSGVEVPVSDMKPGDLIITNGGGHVVMVEKVNSDGTGTVIHAPQPGQTITRENLSAFPIEHIRRVA